MVFGTEFDDRFHAKNVLDDSEEDSMDAKGNYNYWLAEGHEKDGQGFSMKVDNCPRKIADCYIRNTKKGSSWGLYKEFHCVRFLDQGWPLGDLGRGPVGLLLREQTGNSEGTKIGRGSGGPVPQV